MNLKHWLLTSLAAGLTLAAAAAQAQSYTLFDLGTLGGTSSFALDVNNLGQVTGNAQTAVGQSAPRLNTFLWSAPGPMNNLGVLPGSNNFSRGYAINDLGVVVGESDNNSSRAFVHANGTLTGLTRLAGDNDRGVAHGSIVGSAVAGSTPGGTDIRQAVRWAVGGGQQRPHHPGPGFVGPHIQ